jgi:DNA-binding transcriptional MerR regulator
MDALVDDSSRGALQLNAARGDAEIVNFLFIGELSRLVGMTPRAIRFYEREGLITPSRHGRFRVYRSSDQTRLQAISRLRLIGLPIATIRDALHHFLNLTSPEAREEVRRILASHLASLTARQAQIQDEQARTMALHEELAQV